MIREPGGDSALDLAVKRLERAVALLEQRLGQQLARAGAEAGGLFDQDRAKLAAELDQARKRQSEAEVKSARTVHDVRSAPFSSE